MKSMKNKLKITLGVAVVLLVAFLTFYSLSNQSGLINGQPAVDFTAERFDWEKMKLSDLKGKYVLLDFWASWCAPCRKNNPKIVQLYESFHKADFKDADGFEIISVALEKELAPWPKAIKKDKLDWEYHIIDLDSGKDFDNGNIAELYGVKEIPATFLIDPDGMIIGVDLSARKISALLKKAIGD